MSTLVLRVRRGRQLLGTWRLDGQPIEMTLVDEATGRVVGSFTAAGGEDEPDAVETILVPPPPPALPTPVQGGHDEVPVGAGAGRLDGDDFTMPFPEVAEPTEPTADLITDTGETEEARLVERLSRARPRPIPNLASRGEGELEVDTITGPSDLPTQEADPESVAGFDLLALDSGTAPTPVAGLPPDPVPPPSEDDLDLEGFEDIDDDEDPDLDRPTTFGDAVAPAEVWVRRESEWRSGGSLKPGQRAVSRGGWVRLRRDGALIVRPGPSLAGSATLLDGATVEIATDVPPVELPAGASVLLRSGEYGLYIRSETLTGGGQPQFP